MFGRKKATATDPPFTLDVARGRVTLPAYGLHECDGVYYDANGEQTGDPAEAVAFEVEIAPGRKVRLPVHVGHRRARF